MEDQLASAWMRAQEMQMNLTDTWAKGQRGRRVKVATGSRVARLIIIIIVSQRRIMLPNIVSPSQQNEAKVVEKRATFARRKRRRGNGVRVEGGQGEA